MNLLHRFLVSRSLFPAVEGSGTDTDTRGDLLIGEAVPMLRGRRGRGTDPGQDRGRGRTAPAFASCFSSRSVCRSLLVMVQIALRGEPLRGEPFAI